MSLSAQQISDFERDGFVLIDDVFDASDLQPLIEEFEAAIDTRSRFLLQDGKITNLHEELPFDKRLAAINDECEEIFFTLFGKSHHGPALWELIRNSNLLGVVESLVGPEIYCHPTYNVRPKLPRQERTVVPWHQDAGYLTPDADGSLIVSCWIPLVDATVENGCMELIAGSHREGIVQHENVIHYLDIDETNLPAGRRITMPVPKGSLLLLHSMTVHRSLPNTSDGIRWSVDLRYQDPAQPTGRDFVPGFMVRSARGAKVCSREEWVQSLRDAGQFDEGRSKDRANPFALRTDWSRPASKSAV